MRNFVLWIAFLVAMAAAPVAQAGKCYNRNCRQCYPQQYKSAPASKFSWREAIIKLEQTKQDYAAFNEALGKVAGGGGGAYASAQIAGVGAGGAGYAQSTYGEFSSYPIQGNTLLGVNAYSTNPLVDLNATLNLQGKLAQQLANGAHASAADTADLASTVYTLENDRQAKIAAFSAIQAVAQGAPPQPTVNTFRYQQTTQPAAVENVTTQAGPAIAHAQPQVTASALVSTGDVVATGPTLESVLSTKCASCHTGAEAKGGLNLADVDLEGLKLIVERVNLPPDDPKFMPQRKGTEGFEPGEPLAWKERHALEAALVQATGGQ